MATKFSWMNGRLVPWEQSALHISTEAVLRGASVFEGIRAYRADSGDLLVFRLADHLSRLFQTSMRFMRMTLPYDNADITAGVQTLLEGNNIQGDARIRVVAYFDELRLGNELEADTGVFIIVSEGETISSGTMRVTLSPWRRLSDITMAPRVKASANYLNSRIAATDALSKGFDSAILVNDRGKVSEGPSMNVFLVRDGVLITPRVTDGILEGITRSTVLDIARNGGIPVDVREVDPTELYIADELFFCGTAYEVTPVVEIDRYDIGQGKPGPITTRLRDAYFAMVRGQAAAPDGWITTVRPPAHDVADIAG